MLNQILIHHSDLFLTNSNNQWISKASQKAEDMKKTHLACYGKSNITLHTKVFSLKSFKWAQSWKTGEGFPAVSDAFSVCEQENDFVCLNTEFLTTAQNMLVA